MRKRSLQREGLLPHKPLYKAAGCMGLVGQVAVLVPTKCPVCFYNHICVYKGAHTDAGTHTYPSHLAKTYPVQQDLDQGPQWLILVQNNPCQRSTFVRATQFTTNILQVYSL